jgi:hypothetical protein
VLEILVPKLVVEVVVLEDILVLVVGEEQTEVQDQLLVLEVVVVAVLIQLLTKKWVVAVVV